MVVYKDLEKLSWYYCGLYSLALLGIVVGILTVAFGCFRPEDEEEETMDPTKSGELVEPSEMVGENSNATSHVSKAVSESTVRSKQSNASIGSQLSSGMNAAFTKNRQRAPTIDSA